MDSEQGILDLTYQMTMAATAYESKRLLERDTTIALVQGFIGQLKDGGIIYVHKKIKN